MNRQKLNRINQLAELIGKGTQEETNNAFNEMMEIYNKEFRLIINHWAKVHNYSLDKDDLIQIASTTLFTTALKWNDSKRGRDFACYVNPAIQRALVKATSEDAPIRVPYGSQQNKRYMATGQRVKRKGSEKIYVNSIDKLKTENQNFSEGTTQSVETIYLIKERNESLYKAILDLPEESRDLVLKYFGFYGENQSYSELAKELGLTKQAVNYRMSIILNDLKLSLKKMHVDADDLLVV